MFEIIEVGLYTCCNGRTIPGHKYSMLPLSTYVVVLTVASLCYAIAIVYVLVEGNCHHLLTMGRERLIAGRSHLVVVLINTDVVLLSTAGYLRDTYQLTSWRLPS